MTARLAAPGGGSGIPAILPAGKAGRGSDPLRHALGTRPSLPASETRRRRGAAITAAETTGSGVRVLGVDPGSLSTGWGLVGGSVARPALIACGVIRLSAGRSLPERLHRLRVDFEVLLERFSPTAAAVESPFHGANARAALQLAHARGVVLAALGGAGVPVAEYTPATVKKAVTGTGRAEKLQIQAMIGRLLGDGARGSPDLADALAVALCHLTNLAFRRALSHSRSPR